MGSRRTNKVVLMIDKVKAWCRMCIIMRDCDRRKSIAEKKKEYINKKVKEEDKYEKK